MRCDPTLDVSRNEPDGTIQLDTWESTRCGPRIDGAIRDAQPLTNFSGKHHVGVGFVPHGLANFASLERSSILVEDVLVKGC